MLTSRLKILYVIYPDKILENIKTLWYIKDNLIFSNTKQDDKRHFTEKVEKRYYHLTSRHHFARALLCINP